MLAVDIVITLAHARCKPNKSLSVGPTQAKKFVLKFVAEICLLYVLRSQNRKSLDLSHIFLSSIPGLDM